MNVYLKKVLVMAVVMFAATAASAQFATRNAKSVTPGQQEGVYYSVPKTVLRLDFRIEESVLIEGPYSAYADRYLGSANVARGKSRQFKLVDVTINSCSAPDPDATFFVEFTRKAAKRVSVGLDGNGILETFVVGDNPFVSNANQTVGDSDNAMQTKGIDTSMIFRAAITPAMGRPLEQQARAAAEKITEIRDAKMKLLTGFQEVAFEGDAVKSMYAELDAMENEYLSLFLGKRLTKEVVRSVYVTPTRENNIISVARFSLRNGLSSSQGDGEMITLTVMPSETTSSIKAPSHSAIESATHENKLVYRIPETANVKVACGSRLLAEKRCVISQLGVLLLAPIGKGQNGLLFDTTTGQLIGVSRE